MELNACHGGQIVKIDVVALTVVACKGTTDIVKATDYVKKILKAADTRGAICTHAVLVIGQGGLQGYAAANVAARLVSNTIFC